MENCDFLGAVGKSSKQNSISVKVSFIEFTKSFSQCVRIKCFWIKNNDNKLQPFKIIAQHNVFHIQHHQSRLKGWLSVKENTWTNAWLRIRHVLKIPICYGTTIYRTTKMTLIWSIFSEQGWCFKAFCTRILNLLLFSMLSLSRKTLVLLAR